MISHSSSKKQRARSAFTLVELLISMTITSVILLVMLALTATVADAWKKSRGAIFSNTSARAAFDRIVTDVESAHYVRTLKDAEWFRFLPDPDSNLGDNTNGSSAPTWAMFFTSPVDRDSTLAGDVIGISYRLAKQPVVGGNSDFDLWALYRAFPNQYGDGSNPAKMTFDVILGETDIHSAFWANASTTQDTDYLLAANVLDFQVVPWIRLADGDLQKVPSDTEVSVTSDGVAIGGSTIDSARLYAVEISLTVLSEAGIDQMRAGTFDGQTIEKFLQQNSRTFTRLIRIYPELPLRLMLHPFAPIQFQSKHKL